MPDGDRYELVDGYLVERTMGAKSSRVGAVILRILDTYATRGGLGIVFNSEAMYRCFGNRNTFRKPDASFVAVGRFPNNEIPDGFIDIAPDLAIEVISPNDLIYTVEEKLRDYLKAGVREVWIVHPKDRWVRIHRPDDTIRILHENNTITGGDVIPGFSCLVRDFFAV